MTDVVLKKQRNIRGGHRGHVKKLLAKVESAIANFEPSLQERLSQQKIILREKLDTLKTLDSKILELIDDEGAIEAEVMESSELTDDITWAMVRIESKLKSLEINSPSVPQQSHSTGNPNAHHEAQPSGAAARLPKLELKRFNGRPEDWQAFIDCFDSAVHSNPKLNNIDKMNYLKSLVEGPAAAAIKGLLLTSANYKVARDILEQRYGNKQLIINAHMDNLLKLPVVSSVTDIKGIRQLYDKTEIHIRGLQALGIEAEQYGSLLVPVLLSKVPQELRLIISRKFDTEAWNLDELLKVFKTEVEARERCHLMATTPSTTPERRPPKPTPISAATLLSPETHRITCTFCKNEHRSVDCDIVTSIRERREIVKKQGRCFICLKRAHIAKNCDSKRFCPKCSQRHHPSLCMASQTPASDNSVASDLQSSTSSNDQPSPTVNMYVDSKTSVLLQTCVALASNPNSVQPQEKCHVRLILDSGSQKTYITQQLKESLGLKPIAREKLCLKTFGSDYDNLKTVDVVNLCLKNVDNGPLSVIITAHVVPLICSPLNYQVVQFAKRNYSHLVDVVLSEGSSAENLPVDILIGADQYWNIANGEIKQGTSGPVAMNTKFGWTLSGPVENAPRSDTHSVNLAATHVLRIDTHRDEFDVRQQDMEMDNKLRTFWELESLGINLEENSVLETFNSTVTFKNQRYEVGLPWKEVHDTLPDNYSLSERRLQSLLKRLKLKPEQLAEYDHVIKDQLNRGIVEKIDKSEETQPDRQIHYLPHHCVVREDKATTKLRIVYNASARENGPALNDCLHTGPSLTPDILDILIRFRLQPIALVADIEKAFLMIAVKEEDRDVLRFLWIDNVNAAEPKIVKYRFARVVFGVTSSPFLLNATLHKHITNYEKEDPEFVRQMLRSLYVDDLSLSLTELEQAYQLYIKSRERMNQGGFNLRKWLTNSKPLMKKITGMEAQNEVSTQTEKEIHLTEDDETFNRVMVGGLEERDSNTEQKVLGTNWNYVEDEFLFKFQTHVESARGLKPTKRNVLRVIAGLYDPMGLVSPIIVKMKILLQDICKANYHWDADLNSELKTRWQRLISELEQVNTIRIPRCVSSAPDTKELTYELAGFGDASTSAYAAVIYLVVKSRTGTRVQLIASKTRVAPLKKQTTPRLELLAALILARLIARVKSILEQCLVVCRTRCWTDSKNVLYWIKRKDREWKQFVNHRVAEIRQLLPTDVWAHVPGVENPADLASRGVNPVSLVNSTLWWNGPPWLSSQDESVESEDVTEMDQPPPDCLKEMKVQAVRNLEDSTSLLVKNTPEVGISHVMNCEDYNDFTKLCRVTSYVMRFVKNVKARTSRPVGPVNCGSLTSEEMASSELLWIKESQKTMPASGKFKQQCIQLGVIKDENGILRCKGRLCNSPLPEAAKLPAWLPSDHHVTRLVIWNCHQRVMHNGVRETLMELRSRFWLTKGRQSIRKQIYRCFVCRRHEGKPYKAEPSSDMPEFRFKEGQPFASTGVDFAGPLYVKSVFGKEVQISKVYICLFTCGSTRAVHIELTPNLTAHAFIRCLRRFVARRGTPELLISDNAKTFKAASSQLTRIFNDPDTTSFLLERKIQWRFNLEKAPWWGGFFERMIKCTKRCLKKTLGNARLTYEELMTVLSEVECILNSRPLTYLYPDDLEEPLTPSHLMSGRRLLSLPDVTPSRVDNPVSTRESVTKRARYLQRLMDHFWNRWRREYVPALRESHRLKGESTGQTVQLGDIVNVHDESLPRAQWRMGVVCELIKGADKKTRGAVVRTVDKERVSFLRRPLQRLFPLEVQDELVKSSESCTDKPTSTVKEGIQAPPREMSLRPRRQAAQAGEERRRHQTNAYGPIG